MTRKRWSILSITLGFFGLGAFILINDINYRQESAYRNIQIETFSVYSDWNVYIGTLRGLLLTTRGFESTLNEAKWRKEQTERKISALKADSAKVDREIQVTLKAFIESIEEGLKIGQELQDAGYLFLEQPDLPLVYSEGRLGLYSLIGKDATSYMGELAAYQYYQIVGRLKGMNVLFDQLFSDRLDAFLEKIASQSEKMRHRFFTIRIIFLSLTLSAIILALLRLYLSNRALRRLADQVNEELDSTRTHLTEVQGFLKSAEFQNSLFDMVAGISHELNTPLGNCMALSTHLENRSAEVRAKFETGNLSRGEFLESFSESEEGLRIIQSSLEQMRLQIDTFKRLSGVNHELEGALISLAEYVRQELPRLAMLTAPTLKITANVQGDDSIAVRGMYLNQIFSQLFANSAEHGRAALCTVRFEVTDSMLTVICADDGQGVTDSMLQRMAEPFFTTARGAGHMGLGLSIAASLVNNKLRGTMEFAHGRPGLRVTVRTRLSDIQ